MLTLRGFHGSIAAGFFHVLILHDFLHGSLAAFHADLLLLGCDFSLQSPPSRLWFHSQVLPLPYGLHHRALCLVSSWFYLQPISWLILGSIWMCDLSLRSPKREFSHTWICNFSPRAYSPRFSSRVLSLAYSDLCDIGFTAVSVILFGWPLRFGYFVISGGHHDSLL